MLNKKETGDLGELRVQQHLINNGYTILARNYKKKHGELDIVAQKGNLTAVVEVKTRKQSALQRGVLAVDSGKRARIIKTTQLFLIENEIEQSGSEIRFDIAEIIISDFEPSEIIDMNYFENAFDATDIGDFLFV